jgi:putative nucleotidyltransferase with HDIG domain
MTKISKAFQLFELLSHRDILTAQHSINVACLMYILESYYINTGLGADNAFIAGLLHDIGKVKLPDYVFSNYVIDTQEDKNVIMQHPAYSKYLIVKTGFDTDIVNAVFQHHERFDGSGYPAGIQKNYITPAARSLAIADSFSALTEDRPYRAGISIESAVNILIRDRSLYDPKMLSVFLNNITHIKELVNVEYEKYKFKVTKNINEGVAL